MTGVELDPTTAGIAAALYPSADIVTVGFEGPSWNEGAFTAAIGNVPFGNFKLYDPSFNPRGHSIHNHFLLKALRLTAPGGVLAMLTSTYTWTPLAPPHGESSTNTATCSERSACPPALFAPSQARTWSPTC
jgi:hypothetical protein